MEKKLIKEIDLEIVFTMRANLILPFYMLPGCGFCCNKNREHPQSSSVFCSLDQLEHLPIKLRQVSKKIEIETFFMPDAKRDSALIFMSSKPLTCGILSQTGLTVTTYVKNRE